MMRNAFYEIFMSRHKEAYVMSYHETLCHDMSYVTTIVASQLERFEKVHKLFVTSHFTG